MKPIVVVGLLVVGLVIAGGVSNVMNAKPKEAAKSTCELPPDLHPADLIGLVSSKKEEHRSYYAALVGCSVPASGWEGQVTSVDGNTVRFEVGTGLGAYTISVVMRETPSVQPGTVIKYRGRLEGASAKVVMGNVMNRIELSDGEIVK